MHSSVNCFVSEFSTFLTVFVNILLQIKTIPVKMRLWYFRPVVLMNSNNNNNNNNNNNYNNFFIFLFFIFIF